MIARAALRALRAHAHPIRRARSRSSTTARRQRRAPPTAPPRRRERPPGSWSMSVAAAHRGAFAARRQRDWDELDALVRAARAPRASEARAGRDRARSRRSTATSAPISPRAQAARYSAPLVDYLPGPHRGGAHGPLRRRPRAARARTPGVAVAAARGARAPFRAPCAGTRRRCCSPASLFFVPFFGGLAATLADPTFAFRIVPEGAAAPADRGLPKGFDAGRGGGHERA